MSMRAARAGDLWLKAFARNYASRYEGLEYEDLRCLGTGQVRFNGGVSAIVGGNGVGKSTLAAALGELLETEIAERFVGERVRLVGSKLTGSLREGDEPKRREAVGDTTEERRLRGDRIGTESWWLDPGYWAFHTRKQVVSDPNFADVIEGLTPINLNEDELGDLAYVVGKRYESCRIYEVSDYSDLNRFPYFRVTANGVDYSSQDMGQGELSLMIVLWVLRDLRPNSILILEEPESHVSPRSQTALMNVIARAAAEKGIWIIITTHSPTIVERIPTEHLRMLVRTDARIEVMENTPRHAIAGLLGSGHSFNAVALVEDEVAKEFVIALLDQYSPDLLRQVEIVNTGGESKISAALASLPLCRGVRLIGIYDGDQTGKIRDQAFNWPYSFLPGEVDPAKLLVDNVHNAAASDNLTAALPFNRAAILAVVNALTGVEPRDWVTECAQRLATGKDTIVRALVGVWLASPGASEAAKAFVRTFEDCYDSRR